MPVVDGLPRSVVRGHVTPRQPASSPPEHSVDHRAVIGPSTTPLRGLIGQQRLQPSPFLIGQVVTIEHADGLPHPPVKIHGTRSSQSLHGSRGLTDTHDRLRDGRVSIGPGYRWHSRGRQGGQSAAEAEDPSTFASVHERCPPFSPSWRVDDSVGGSTVSFASRRGRGLSGLAGGSGEVELDGRACLIGVGGEDGEDVGELPGRSKVRRRDHGLCWGGDSRWWRVSARRPVRQRAPAPSRRMSRPGPGPAGRRVVGRRVLGRVVAGRW